MIAFHKCPICFTYFYGLQELRDHRMGGCPAEKSEATLDERLNSSDAVHHPSHYGGDTTYETIKVIEAWGLGFSLGNAVKYIARAGKKPGTDKEEDLRKALWYIQHEIERISGADH